MIAVFLAAISGMIGVAVRARLENERPVFYLYHCLIIGIVLGLVAFFFYTQLLTILLDFGTSLQIFLIFSMIGYVVSDLLDSFVEIVKPRKRR